LIEHGLTSAPTQYRLYGRRTDRRTDLVQHLMQRPMEDRIIMHGVLVGPKYVSDWIAINRTSDRSNIDSIPHEHYTEVSTQCSCWQWRSTLVWRGSKYC